MSDLSSLRARLPRLAAHPSFRNIAAESLRRGDQARERGHLVPAARHYATAGVTYRFVGASWPAAVAFLELGGAHLALGRLDRLAGVVASIRSLRPVGVPPAGGFLFLRVCAEILDHANTNRSAFDELLDELRMQRQNAPEFMPLPAGSAGRSMAGEASEMTEPLLLPTLSLDELRRRLTAHPGWEVVENGARLERVIPLADLRSAGADLGRDLRLLQRSAAEVAQRMVRMGVAVSCSFDGSRLEIRVPATRLGLGFVEECDYAGVTGSPLEEASA